ncbi:hypothetical protein C5167_035431 [Papaver somniferum]|uniref:MORF/ORRM1/DAG-like MORF domain-containing protein n=1 Tax=Papaver somniferum TaxID=3469 RepID=A0A4Y7KJU0_PAPSO|nr:hypothetical protein C5167_035431 [Papaver somniferum]
MKIYSVSVRCYFAFGGPVSEDPSQKITELPGVRWVLPDSYMDIRSRSHGHGVYIYMFRLLHFVVCVSNSL